MSSQETPHLPRKTRGVRVQVTKAQRSPSKVCVQVTKAQRSPSKVRVQVMEQPRDVGENADQ